ncbi:MAG: hypothetical protein EA401_01865 [Planctomycetota bacterium]|nr:MAG: hypothetical protein EA401_01865 [Planctomycetota bacterium]
MFLAVVASGCSARSYSIAIQQGEPDVPRLSIIGSDSVTTRLQAVAETHAIGGWLGEHDESAENTTSVWRLQDVSLQWLPEPTRLMASSGRPGPSGTVEREIHLVDTLKLTATLVRDTDHEDLRLWAYRNPLSDARHRDMVVWHQGRERRIVTEGDQDTVERAAFEGLLSRLHSMVFRHSPTIPLDGRRRELRSILQLADTGHHQYALRSLKKRHQEGDQEASLLYNIGALFEAQGQHDEARSWYARAWNRQPRALYRERLEAVSKKAPASP